jgi:hypothetical protein
MEKIGCHAILDKSVDVVVNHERQATVHVFSRQWRTLFYTTLNV